MTMTNLLTFDGRNLKSIDRGFADGWYTSSTTPRNDAVVGGLTGPAAYRLQAYVFRCVNIRALEVSNFPRMLCNASTGADVTDDPRYHSIADIDGLLFRLEAARCLSGAAYALIDADPRGKNITLKWTATGAVQPRYKTATKELDYFYRQASTPHEVPLDRMIYLWNPNFEDETKPGVGESEVALGPASVLYSLDAFAANYFGTGAVKVTVFPVDPSTSQADVDAFQNFLTRRLSGVRQAFRNIVMRVRPENFKPVVIGSDFKDTAAIDVTNAKREDVAMAHGMSPNVADGGYKYATADSEYLNFVVGTIIPRVNQTFEVLNEQFYSRLNPPLELRSMKELHEAVQAAQLAQAQAVTTLVPGKQIFSVNEAREWLGKEAVAGGDWPTAAERQAQADATTTPSAMAPMQDVGQAGADAMPPMPQVKAALSEWRTSALAAVKAGQLASIPEPPIVVLNWPMCSAVRAELAQTKTASEVRAVFEANWPQRTADDELSRANGLLERALAKLETNAA